MSQQAPASTSNSCVTASEISRVKNKAKKDVPTLWLTTLRPDLPLQYFKAVLPFSHNPLDTALGNNHLLVVNPGVSEYEVKRIALPLLARGFFVQVVELREPVEIVEPQHCTEFFFWVMDHVQDYEEWEEENSQYKLDPEEAINIVELLYRWEPDKIKRAKAVARLRTRFYMDNLEWRGIINSLEKALQLSGQADADTKASAQFKLELNRLASITDPIELVFEQSQMAQVWRIPQSEIKKLVKAVKYQTSVPQFEVKDVDAFLDGSDVAVNWLIPGMLPVGETIILFALPKEGKTLIATDLAFCVATGEAKFLGEEVKQGKVLLVSVDESESSTKKKLLKRGFRKSDKGKLKIISRWDLSQKDFLERTIEDFKPDLVIFDSLKRITAGRDISENSAEFADSIYELKEMLTRYGASGILIHHSNKNPDYSGVAKIRGNTSIPGAVWGTWSIERCAKEVKENGKTRKKIDPTDPTRQLTVICRDAENVSLTVKLDPEYLAWERVAEQQEQQEPGAVSAPQRILDLLAEAGCGLEGMEIANHLSSIYQIPRDTTYKALNRLEQKRLIGTRVSTRDPRALVYFLLAVEQACPQSSNPCRSSTPAKIVDMVSEKEGGGTPKNEGDTIPPPPTEIVDMSTILATSLSSTSFEDCGHGDDNSQQNLELTTQSPADTTVVKSTTPSQSDTAKSTALATYLPTEDEDVSTFINMAKEMVVADVDAQDVQKFIDDCKDIHDRALRTKGVRVGKLDEKGRHRNGYIGTIVATDSKDPNYVAVHWDGDIELTRKGQPQKDKAGNKIPKPTIEEVSGLYLWLKRDRFIDGR